jgi:hypothetical protein
MQLSTEYILENVSQVEIFSRFLDIPVEDIEYAVNHNALLPSAFREEKIGSMGFKYRRNGKLICRDFGGDFWGDCFDAVAEKKWLDVLRPTEFMQVLEAVAIEFGIGMYGLRRRVMFAPTADKLAEKKITSTKKFTIYTRDWFTYDYAYWKNQGVTPEKLEEHGIVPVLDAYIDGNKIYTHRYKCPAYAWYCGLIDETEIWKLYAPAEKFFRTNGASTYISERLHKADIGLICKSKKDLMAIESVVEEVTTDPSFLQGFDMPSESVHPTLDQITFLRKYWNVIYSNTDFDRQGVTAANKMKRQYGIQPIIMTNGRFGTTDYGAKDFSEYHAKFGHDAAVKLITDLLTKLK